MKRFALCLALLTVPALAMGVDDPDANINLLLTAFDPGLCGGPFGYIDEGGCADLVSSGQVGTALLWVVVSHEGGFNGFPDGSIGAAQFGIEYGPGAGIQGWFLCTGGLEAPTPNWPLQSGEANAVTWANACYAPVGTAARAGFFIVLDGMAADYVELVYDDRIGDALWADCGDPPTTPPIEYSICGNAADGTAPEAGQMGNLGWVVGFDGGTTPICGDNCATPTLEKSWGEIKSLY